jgi:hypothetical protein
MHETEREQTYRKGPGPRMHSRAVERAYIDTRAIEFDCDSCQAKHGEFCHRTADIGGGDRKVPCPTRILKAARALRTNADTGGAA